MNYTKHAMRLRKLADKIEGMTHPAPSIQQVEVRIFGYDKENNEAVIAQFYLLPNTFYSTPKFPTTMASEGVRVAVYPRLS